MKYLITGHKGFVGSALMEKFSGQAIGLDKKKSIHDWESELTKLLPAVTAVIHCGAISDNQYKHLDIFDWNVYATQILASHCAIREIYLVYFSSQTARNPKTLYGHTKKLAEYAVQSKPELDACILQPFNIWGDGEDCKPPHCRSLAYRLADHELKKLWDTNRDYVHVKDVVSAVKYALKNRDVGTYHIGTGKSTPSAVLANMVAYNGYVCEDRPPYIEVGSAADTNKFLSGWKPTINIIEELPNLEVRLQQWMDEPDDF